MLNTLRSLANTWVAKILMAVLVVSFGVWGIADIFHGRHGSALAWAGNTEVTAEQFQRDYTRAMQALNQRTGQVMTPAQARAMGVPQQVLGRLVSSTLILDAAHDLGMAASDQAILQQIQSDPTFQGPGGTYDPDLLRRLLAQNGFSQKSFLEAQERDQLRQQLVQGLVGGLQPPKPYLEALNRYLGEERRVAWFTLPASAVGPIPDPSADALQKFYDAHKAEFRAPERRTFAYIDLTPQELADPTSISDKQVQQAYDSSPAYGEPERRHVQQIVFKDQKAADSALAALKSGTPFDKIVAGMNRTMADVDLGTVQRSDIVDPAVAKAAFSQGAGDATVVKGEFGPVLVRTVQVLPAHKKPLAEVAPQIRKDLALQRAKREILGIYNSIEDAFAGGATIEEVGKRFKLPVTVVKGVDRKGKLADGATAKLPDPGKLLPEVFNTEAGMQNAAIQVADGYVWYRVSDVSPAHDQPLATIRGKVLAAWTAQQTDKKLAALAKEAVKKIDGGAPIADVAKTYGASVEETPAFTRRDLAASKLPQKAAEAAFDQPPSKAAAVAGPDGTIVLTVTEATPPAFFEKSADVAMIQKQLAGGLGDTLLTAYVNAQQAKRGVQVNNRLLDQIVGTAGT